MSIQCGMLFFAHGVVISIRAAAKQPLHSVADEFVLQRAGKDFVAVSHVHVEHFVAGVGPDDGDVSTGEQALGSRPSHPAGVVHISIRSHGCSQGSTRRLAIVLFFPATSLSSLKPH